MMERTLTVSMRIAAANQDADAELVDRYLAGDTAAFDEIMIRYERQIYRVCYRFVDNRDDAMDLLRRPQDRLEELARRVPNGRFLPLGGGHSVHRSRPAEFLAAVREFLP